MARRIGAYILMGDPVWLASSLSRYYDRLDDLVLLVPANGIGWTGRALPVQECRDAIKAVDSRGIAREIEGTWVDPLDPLGQDTAQRRAGLAALADCDWVLQIDNDEILPDVDAVFDALSELERRGDGALEWPMQTLYRDLGHGRFLAVVGAKGEPRFDYPGAVAVRPSVQLTSCRRVSSYVRATVPTDHSSLQLIHPAEAGETRLPLAREKTAIVHNSWGRSRRAVWRKVNSWGHAEGWRTTLYYAMTWWPSPVLWRWQRNLHPFSDRLWPRLRPQEIDQDLLVPAERA